jgi:hypothetical protein
LVASTVERVAGTVHLHGRDLARVDRERASHAGHAQARRFEPVCRLGVAGCHPDWRAGRAQADRDHSAQRSNADDQSLHAISLHACCDVLATMKVDADGAQMTTGPRPATRRLSPGAST